MKKLIVLLLTCLALSAPAQLKEWSYDTGYSYSKWDLINLKSKKDARQVGIMSALMFTSGAARGIEQTIVFHYDNFRHRHPNANQNYWNPRYSWTNKYKHHNPDAGPKFLFSTTGLVWITDGKHLMDMLNNVPIYVCITIPIGSPTFKRHTPANIIGRIVMLSLYRQAGFYATYNIFYSGY